jgi:hypothetical protein
MICNSAVADDGKQEQKIVTNKHPESSPGPFFAGLLFVVMACFFMLL